MAEPLHAIVKSKLAASSPPRGPTRPCSPLLAPSPREHYGQRLTPFAVRMMPPAILAIPENC